MKKLYIIISLLFISTLSFLPTSYAAQTNVTKIAAYKVSATTVRVIIYLNQKTDYHYFSLSNPDRMVVDLLNTHKITLKDLPNFKHVAWIHSMRAGTNDIGKQRIVFNLTQAGTMQIQLLKPTKNLPWRLVLDFSPKTVTQAAHKANHKTNANTISTENTTTGTTVNTQVKTVIKTVDSIGKLRCVNVVIDPGHGGKDTGGIGLEGILEKNVVLAIGKDLNNQLNSTPGICSFLTRDGDYFVTLRGRLTIAREHDADLFIAIHADIFHDPKAQGASVFALSHRGATSEGARWLAQRENTSELMGGVELDDKSKKLKSVLLNLSQQATTTDSMELGADILNYLNIVSHLHHHTVEQAGFVVLKSPDIPSVLVETGFLSNAYEEQQLKKSSYQKKVANALYQGTMQYIKANPPEGSEILAWQRGEAHTYIVHAGDSLSVIAEKFQVSINTLKQKNHLSSDQITVGQKLIV